MNQVGTEGLGLLPKAPGGQEHAGQPVPPRLPNIVDPYTVLLTFPEAVGHEKVHVMAALRERTALLLENPSIPTWMG